MYLIERKSTNSSEAAGSYPIVGSLTAIRPVAAPLADVISNDNTDERPSIAEELNMARTMQTLVSSGLEALQEAGDIAKRLKLGSWYAAYLQRHIEDIDAEAIPEIWALIERLEVEAKR